MRLFSNRGPIVMWKLRSENGKYAEWSAELGDYVEGETGRTFIAEPTEFLINGLTERSGLRWEVVEA